MRHHEPVSHFMTPGALTISHAATVADAAAAVDRRRMHAILVVDADTGVPLGWATAEGLMAAMTAGEAAALTAVCEEIVSIPPTDTVAQALDCMKRTGARRLLVRRKPNVAPDGVVSEFDLAAGVGA